MHNHKNVTDLLKGLIALLILHAGTHLSILTKTDLGVSDFFFPSAFSLILIYWTRAKIILPAVYINAVISSYFWGNPLENWPIYFVYAIPETIFAFLTWWLFIILFKGKYWFPDTRNTVLFILTGVFIPALISAFLLQLMLNVTGAQPDYLLWRYIASNLLSEFTNTFFFTLPVLYFVTPPLKRVGYLSKIKETIPLPSSPTLPVILEMSGMFLGLLGLVFLVEFREYWFIYGVFPLYIAIRFGFGPTIVTNIYILIIIYILPKVLDSFGENTIDDYRDVMNIFLGACLLFIFAIVTGRVISDLKSADRKLKHQYAELEKTNQELNQFVYRVSHDISAPLKSVRGLVNLGKLSAKQEEHPELFNRIEMSILRLEEFIFEILDYFNNKRYKINIAKINLKALCEEVIEGMPHSPMTKSVKVTYQLSEEEIYQDRVRLKIILRCILHNAFRYQKNTPEHHPFIKIISAKTNEGFQIKIEDNGVGIQKDQLDNIFAMFYRGHIHSVGSGLGLYIAKEVTVKLNGSISVNSIYGEGTTFTILLRDQRPVDNSWHLIAQEKSV